MIRRFRTIDALKEVLALDRVGFIKGLIAAGFTENAVFNATESNDHLIRLALLAYNDKDFDVMAFENAITIVA